MLDLLRDPKGGLLRAAMYPRLRAHYQFANELSLFADVDHHKKYSINIYGQWRPVVRFRQMANLYAPQTVSESLKGLAMAYEPLSAKVSSDASSASAEVSPGTSSVLPVTESPVASHKPTPGIKRDEGGWNTDGHPNRVIEVDEAMLATFGKLYDVPGTPPAQARLPAIHSRELVSVLQKFANASRRLGDLKGDYYTTVCFDESNAQKDGTIKRQTDFVNSLDEFILSGPHFYVGNPPNKTPRTVCTLNSHYDVLDLETLPDDYLPRSNYRPACSPEEYRRRIPRVSWVEEGEEKPRLVTEGFRLGLRRKLAQSGERTLVR